MIKTHRLGALALLAAACVALLGVPASAAPAGTEATIFVRDLTLPAGGEAVDEIFDVLLFADTAGWADEVAVTFDVSGADVADIEIPKEDCTTAAVVRCVLPGPYPVIQRPKDGLFLTTVGGIWMSLTPKAGASVGDTGTLTVTVQADDGPVTTRTATIRIGEAVNLTAVDDTKKSVAPGGTVELQPRVRNTGPAAVDGLTALFSADDDALAGTDFGNCTYGLEIACTFDTTLAAGDTYRISEPFTVTTPPDSVAGSETTFVAQWLTAAEWEDWRATYESFSDGEPGTGPDLELEEVASSAAGVPQADTDHDDNGTYTAMTVTGARRPDITAFGDAISGRPGDVRTLTAGFVNQGPGTLHNPPFDNNAPWVYLTLPVGISVQAADKRCISLTDDDVPDGFPSMPPSEDAGVPGPPIYECQPRSLSLPAGGRVTYTFTVGITRAAGAAGSIEVNAGQIDRDPRNNQAAITVSAPKSAGGGGGLPITGTAAAATAIGGLLLVLIGFALRRSMR